MDRGGGESQCLGVDVLSRLGQRKDDLLLPDHLSGISGNRKLDRGLGSRSGRGRHERHAEWHSLRKWSAVDPLVSADCAGTADRRQPGLACKNYAR